MVKLSTCSHIPSKHCNDSYDKPNGEKMKKVGEIEKNEKRRERRRYVNEKAGKT